VAPGSIFAADIPRAQAVDERDRFVRVLSDVNEMADAQQNGRHNSTLPPRFPRWASSSSGTMVAAAKPAYTDVTPASFTLGHHARR
jgi:hypothetical protein